MITSSMTLDTKMGADFWAAEMLAGTEYGEREKQILSDWIWNNKPEIGCTLADHPINDMSNEEVFDIID